MKRQQTGFENSNKGSEMSYCDWGFHQFQSLSEKILEKNSRTRGLGSF